MSGSTTRTGHSSVVMLFWAALKPAAGGELHYAHDTQQKLHDFLVDLPIQVDGDGFSQTMFSLLMFKIYLQEQQGQNRAGTELGNIMLRALNEIVQAGFEARLHGQMDSIKSIQKELSAPQHQSLARGLDQPLFGALGVRVRGRN